LKESVKGFLNAANHEALDVGTHSKDPVDYADYAAAVGEALRERRAERGIILCGSGVGASMAANRIPGIRAGLCHDTYSAHQGVEHDDMNVLVLGGRVVGSELARELIHSFLNAHFSGEERHLRRLAKVTALENRLRALQVFGQSVWLDYIRRDLMTSGELKRLIERDGLGGMTSNPTIFEKAIAGSRLYDAEIRAQTDAGRSAREIFEHLGVADVRAACDAFAGVYDASDGGDGLVSLEVSPLLAYDTDSTLRAAKVLFAQAQRPNVFIKIPGTKEGLPAIEEAARLTSQAGNRLNALISTFGPMTIIDRGVHPALAEGARLFFAGQYQQALTALNPPDGFAAILDGRAAGIFHPMASSVRRCVAAGAPAACTMPSRASIRRTVGKRH
jgi:transaldolase/glucose-6-phosphate isomerase